MELVALNNIIMISTVEQRRDEKVFQEYYLDSRYSTHTHQLFKLTRHALKPFAK